MQMCGEEEQVVIRHMSMAPPRLEVPQSTRQAPYSNNTDTTRVRMDAPHNPPEAYGPVRTPSRRPDPI